MFSLNRAQVIGNLTRDPELRVTPNGQSVASFSIATNRRWTSKDGESQEDTQYHEIVAWGKLAEISSQILFKGKKAYVEGRLQTRMWDGADGAKRNRTEIVADNIIALSPRAGADSDYSANFPATDDSTPTTPKSTSKGASTPSKGKKTATDDSSASIPGSDDAEIKLEDIPF